MAAVLGVAISAHAEIVEVRLTLPPHLDRADLYVLKPRTEFRAILVLCPGLNGNGKALVESAKWQEFAEQNDLAICGLSFSSSLEDIEERIGYLHPGNGAGEAFVAGLRKAFGRDYPLLLFGFSGGAQFTARFAEWKPTTVLAWCAYAAGSWDKPSELKNTPPGIVACGENDPRYGAALGYFLQGRAVGRHWAWVSLADTGHQMNAKLDDFVRAFFRQAIHPLSHPEWRDVDLKTVLTDDEVSKQPTLACWLPSHEIAQAWQKIHQP